jgi:hypothetical protein
VLVEAPSKPVVEVLLPMSPVLVLVLVLPPVSLVEVDDAKPASPPVLVEVKDPVPVLEADVVPFAATGAFGGAALLHAA